MNLTGERITIAIFATVLMFGVFALAYQKDEPEVRVVCVEWFDAKGELGWMTAEEYDPIARMISCGHLVSEDDQFIVLAVDRSLEATPYYNNVGSILAGMIQRRWEVR